MQGRVSPEAAQWSRQQEREAGPPVDAGDMAWVKDREEGAWELFEAPSDEALWWLRHAPDFVAPGGSSGGLAWVRDVLVAPMTQLTFVSFPLQAFLFSVLHQSRAARVGHLVGMLLVNLGLLGLAAWLTQGWPGVDGAALLSGALLCWYAAVSRDARLSGWWFAMVPVVGGLYAGAHGLSATWLTGGQALLAWGAMIVGGAGVSAVSHVFESHVPPRIVHPMAWVPTAEAAWGPRGVRVSPAEGLRRLMRLLWLNVMGLLNELWASPRLLPYNVLFLMMDLGYAPRTRAQIQGWTQRAWASGNPALDFVGVGGGLTLDRLRRAADAA